MKTLGLVLAVAMFVVAPSQQTAAQSPEMPLPYAVIMDADNKAMVQVVGFSPESSAVPRVMFSFDGVPSLFELGMTGGVFSGVTLKRRVHFSNLDCAGEVVGITPTVEATETFLDVVTKTGFVIMGPDPQQGTYRVFRATSPTWASYFNSSWWDPIDGCTNRATPGNSSLLPAEEMIPNPLSGYHGPTTDNPDRELTIKGGTRLP